ncbi:MAG: response regulator [Sedimentisphaerales bacterium]|jgi:DNA-binding response OmpR family regulator
MQVKGKILAVDDDHNNITILKELLDDNYSFKAAPTGEQALKIAQDFRPDIILVDIMMPGMNGHELCRRLREHCKLKHTKIIIVSARAMITDRLEGYRAGADDYITKPFEGDELLAKVRVYLSLKHTEEEVVDRMKDEVNMTEIEKLRTPVLVAKNIISNVTANVFGKIDPILRHQLEIANECLNHLERTINNFLDISEIYSGKVELQPTLFSMQSVVLEVINLFKPNTASRKIDLNTDMPTEELLVNADRQKITKILANLIGDAIRVTHEGDSIYIRVKDLKDRIGVDVESNGQSIESNKIDDLFNLSVQIEDYVGSSRQSTSSGLAVAKGLVELHGGCIWAKNRPQGGVVFSFEIPIAAQTKTETQPALSGAAADSGVCE